MAEDVKLLRGGYKYH